MFRADDDSRALCAQQRLGGIKRGDTASQQQPGDDRAGAARATQRTAHQDRAALQQGFDVLRGQRKLPGFGGDQIEHGQARIEPVPARGCKFCGEVDECGKRGVTHFVSARKPAKPDAVGNGVRRRVLACPQARVDPGAEKVRRKQQGNGELVLSVALLEAAFGADPGVDQGDQRK